MNRQYTSKKYGRTPHLPWSPNSRDPDHRMSVQHMAHLMKHEVVVTEKLDGGNACLTSDGVYARTHAVQANHKSFDWLKARHAGIKSRIPEEYSVFGELVFAVHSIRYETLPDHYMVFAVRDDSKMRWLAWDDVDLWANELGFPTVPVLFRGHLPTHFSEQEQFFREFADQPSLYGPDREGIVVRVTHEFPDSQFGLNLVPCVCGECIDTVNSPSVAKWVRQNHVQTDDHWSLKPIERQGLRKY